MQRRRAWHPASGLRRRCTVEACYVRHNHAWLAQVIAAYGVPANRTQLPRIGIHGPALRNAAASSLYEAAAIMPKATCVKAVIPSRVIANHGKTTVNPYMSIA
jgi:hypothetical protein